MTANGRGRIREAAMELVQLVVLSVIGVGCGWLAFSLWLAWEQAIRSSASPGAIVLPVIAGALAITSIGTFFRVALMLRKRGHRVR